jgi:hypothetical protein
LLANYCMNNLLLCRQTRHSVQRCQVWDFTRNLGTF